MSQVIQTSSHWPGLVGVKRLVIFGDSYSSVTFMHSGFSEDDHPTAENPMQVKYPGVTYNERDLPNWVGHLITKYLPPPCYNPSKVEQETEYQDDPVLVYNYARGGDQVGGISRQVRRLFLPLVGTKPSWAPWNSENTLFITSVGINDCAFSDDHEPRISALMDIQDELYACGARNFLLFDVPPIDQAPAIAEKRLRHGLELNPELETTFQRWNRLLVDALHQFKRKHSDCTVLVFSLFRVFSALMENPEAYGFAPSDKHRRASSIWMDHIHPTSKVHDAIAHSLSDFLGEIPYLQTK